MQIVLFSPELESWRVCSNVMSASAMRYFRGRANSPKGDFLCKSDTCTEIYFSTFLVLIMTLNVLCKYKYLQQLVLIFVLHMTLQSDFFQGNRHRGVDTK